MYPIFAVDGWSKMADVGPPHQGRAMGEVVVTMGRGKRNKER